MKPLVPTFLIRMLMLLMTILAISGCSLLPQAYVALPDDKAQLKTHSAIMNINGKTPSDEFIIAIEPGEHTFSVRYLALLDDYQCRFNFNAQGGRYYEVVDHFNGHPLVLYRLHHSNWFWYQRVNPIFPENCTVIEE